MFAAVVAVGLLGGAAMPVWRSTRPQAAQDRKAPRPRRRRAPAQLAERERIKKCGVEWKAAKAANKIEKGMKWPQYWSACNKRLKEKGA